MSKDEYSIMPKDLYKKAWKTNLKKDFVVIRKTMKKDGEHYIPQKTFSTRLEAKDWIHKKRRY